MARVSVGHVVGPPGADAEISGATAQAQTLQPTDSATAAVTTGGTAGNRSFAFAFGIPKGAKGDPGQDGPNRITTDTATAMIGVLAGNGSNVTAKTVDSAPAQNADHLITSKGVDDALDALKATTVNPNLLDNWYFTGGGTAGYLPINQRGITQYQTAGGKIFDRWWHTDATGTIQLTNAGATIPTGCGIYQHIELARIRSGEKYTLSVLWANGFASQTGTLTIGTSGWQILTGEVSGAGVIGIRQRTVDNENYFQIVVWGNGSTLIAVKLELGDTQTLIHEDNGNRVLNATPNYGEELAKCRRYYQVLKAVSKNLTLTVGCATSTSDVYAGINLSPMRATPRITPSASLKLGTSSYDKTVSIVQWFTFDANSGFGTIQCQVTQSALTEGAFYRIAVPEGYKVEFSAEI